MVHTATKHREIGMARKLFDYQMNNPKNHLN